MVDEKITELTVLTLLEDTDLFPVVDDVAGTPITKAIAHSDIIAESEALMEAVLAGKKTVYIPASAMTPRVTGGCADLATAETTSGRPDISHLAFDGGNTENAQFSFSFPKAWNLGTITYQVHWTGLVSGAGFVSWRLSAVAAGDDDTIDTTFGTQIEVVDEFLAIEDEHISAESAALTIKGSPADRDMIYFNFERDPTDGDDTRNADANLLGITIFYTVNTLKDD